eukprot:20631-Eustigmatos_ZCMA.PRE.1
MWEHAYEARSILRYLTCPDVRLWSCMGSDHLARSKSTARFIGLPPTMGVETHRARAGVQRRRQIDRQQDGTTIHQHKDKM